MPWRLIQFIVLFAILLLFVIFNLENKCDINYGYGSAKLENVPVFLTVFISFMAGILFTLPFVFIIRSRKKDKSTEGKGLLAKASDKLRKKTKPPQKDNKEPDDSTLFDSRHYGID